MSSQQSSASPKAGPSRGFFAKLNRSFSLIENVSLAEEIDWRHFKLFGKTPKLHSRSADYPIQPS